MSAGMTADQRPAYAELRSRCPVAPDESGAWVLLGHADVVKAAEDPAAFSSRVSRHLNVPNGMDGEEHARFRALVDRYLEPEAVARLEPGFRQLATDLARSLPRYRLIEAVSEFGARFAVRAQSAWLGWPAELERPLLRWMQDNRAATRSREPARTAEVARRFDRIVHSLIEARREAGPNAPLDPTTRLLSERIEGRLLTDAELVSILRNWTAGDLGSIAACIGVIIHRLAIDRELQDRWRDAPLKRAEFEAEIDEILRIDDPFTYNRRVVTKDVEIGGRRILAGEQVKLNWTAANRDPEVVGDPDAFRPVENAPHNLVYGVGPHVCPGRALATLELRAAIEGLLTVFSSIELSESAEPVRELPPNGGYRSVPILVIRSV